MVKQMLSLELAREVHGRYVLVTGAAGFIGSRLVELLALLGANIIAVDAILDTTYPAETKLFRWEKMKSQYSGKVEFLEIDLRNLPEVKKLPKVEIIYHLAAMPGLEKSWQDFDMYVSCNVIATNHLITYATDKQVDRFVHASTSSVYGKYATGNEEAILRPNSPYGVTKLAAENLILAHNQNFGFSYAILRYFSVYGKNQRPDMAFSIFARQMLHDIPILIHGDGSQTRSNTHIDDIVITTIIAGFNQHFQNQILNVCGNSELSILEAVNIIATALGKVPIVTHGPERPGDQQKTYGDNSKLAAILDVTQFGDVSELLADCFKG
jgi:nucleoside-diphosphate-sugar epimerase